MLRAVIKYLERVERRSPCGLEQQVQDVTSHTSVEVEQQTASATSSTRSPHLE